MKIFSTLFITTLCFLFQIKISAQSWQWINRVGGLWNLGKSQGEVPYDMISDDHGNLYVISRVYPAGAPDAGGNTMDAFTSNAQCFAITSYSCDGDYRWSKMIGSAAGALSRGISTDAYGNVYGIAQLYSQTWSPGDFDDDYALPPSERSVYLYKYDSLGTFQWATSPLPDTITIFNAIANAFPIDLHVTSGGDITMFCQLPAGLCGDGQFEVPDKGVYAMSYDANGNFLSAVELPIESLNSASFQMSVWFNKLSDGRIVMNGYSFYPDIEQLSIGGIPTPHAFVACFSSTGELLWHHQFEWYDQVYSNSYFLGRSVVDEEDNIYLAGGASHLDQIAGHVFTNSLQENITSMPIIMKFSDDGEVIWGQNANSSAATIAFACAVSGNTVACAGKYPAIMQWQNSNDQLHHLENQGYDSFLSVFDKNTGAFLYQDSIASTYSTDETIYCMTSMPGGNYGAAGYFPSELITPDGVITAVGGGDTFFGKFGTESCPVESSLGNSEQDATVDVIVFPNPVMDCIRVKTDAVVIRAELVNLLGEHFAVRGNQQKGWDVRHLADGTYFLRLTFSNGSVMTKPFVKCPN